MKIGILSRFPRSYSTRRIREAAEARDHKVRVLDTLYCSLSVEAQDPELYYRGKRMATLDAVVPRIGASITFYGCAVVRQFEQMGVFSLNASQAITVSRDKLRTMQILSRHDIGMPPTAFVKDRAEVMKAIERVGGAPVIIKLLEGTQGVGVILAETNRVATAIVETLQSARQNVLIQKFVSESKGRDVRAFVIGDRVVAAMRRRAQGQEFRSNVHRGGTTESVTLDAEYERTAVKAAQIMGLRVAGVDMLESDEGPQVMEVNSSPGLEGIERATDTDIASLMIDHIEEQVMFPEVDLRQHLRFAKGYTVAEFTVSPDSELAGKSLAESVLRERDVLVLNITRSGVVLPAPHGDTRIMARDHLLCYGKLLTLQQMIPHEQPRKRPKRRKKKTTRATSQ